MMRVYLKLVKTMPSIFVWAATSPLSSSSSITQYIGSDWFLEDNGTTSASYQYNGQQFDGETLIWKAIKKPNDWVGSHILEMQKVSYQRIKADSYGIAEQLGNWIRCIIEEDTADAKQVRDWVTQEKPQYQKQAHPRGKHLQSKHSHHSHHQYDTCLIRYDMPKPVVNC